MSDCRFGVSPVNYPDPDPDVSRTIFHWKCIDMHAWIIQQFDWLGFLSIAFELCTKIVTLRH